MITKHLLLFSLFIESPVYISVGLEFRKNPSRLLSLFRKYGYGILFMNTWLIVSLLSRCVSGIRSAPHRQVWSRNDIDLT